MKQKSRTLPVGMIIFGAIIIYMVISLVRYFSSPHTNAYEVQLGRLTYDSTYTGVVLRKEEIHTADESGFITFYQSEGEKVRGGMPVYSLNGNDTGSAEQSDAVPDADELKKLESSISEFQKVHSDTKFEQTYDFLYQMKSQLLDLSNRNSSQSGNMPGGHVVTSPRDGIIVYTLDELEDLTPEQVNHSILKRSNYRKQDLRENRKVANGTPVYKLVTDENWSVCVKLDDAVYDYLSSHDATQADTRIEKDHTTIRADLTLYDLSDGHYAKLDYDNSLVRYISDRYLDITILIEDESGLKVPQSAIFEMTCYQIPNEMLFEDPDSSAIGIYLKDPENGIVFHEVDVYETDEETGMSICHAVFLEGGLNLTDSTGKSAYVLSATQPVRGVYNINKGYASFKRIEEVYSNEEYSIVKEGTSYGLSNYDYIALHAENLQENEFVY